MTADNTPGLAMTFAASTRVIYLSVGKNICVRRSQGTKGPFVDMNGNASDNGGGHITYCSHDYVEDVDGWPVVYD
jgi:hypothetical protein